MVLAPRTGRTRLVEVRAVAGGFPFYGTIATDPARPVGRVPRAGARCWWTRPCWCTWTPRVGDTVQIGDARFVIGGRRDRCARRRGAVDRRSVRGSSSPPNTWSETNLLRFGSLAQYRAYFADARRTRSSGSSIGTTSCSSATRSRSETVAEQEEDLTRRAGPAGALPRSRRARRAAARRTRRGQRGERVRHGEARQRRAAPLPGRAAAHRARRLSAPGDGARAWWARAPASSSGVVVQAALPAVLGRLPAARRRGHAAMVHRFSPGSASASGPRRCSPCSRCCELRR